ncbi:MAG: site-2 protease family protein [Clostridia bacterium]|nr:site-2 protease family protein [Clostridia bacterium]
MISGFLNDPTNSLILLLLSLPGVILAITVHESAHGWAAYLLGDDTAKTSGRISMNPMRHVDLFGLVMLLFFRVGWAKPVVVNVRKFKKPRRDIVITSLAGPLSNLILAFFLLLAAVIFSVAYAANYMKFGDTTFSTVLYVVMQLFQYAAVTNLGLGVFNLIPFPPLDGWKVITSFLPVKAYFAIMRYERYCMIALMVLLITGVISGPIDLGINVLYGVYYKAAMGIMSLFV